MNDHIWNIKRPRNVLYRALDFSLFFILELVLVAHHQVRVRHPQLDSMGEAQNQFGRRREEMLPHRELQSVCRTACVFSALAPRVYLQRQSKVAALCVSDEAGCHGTVGPPAPLQIAHGVLVQVACCHQRAAWPQTSRGELQAALSCQEAARGSDAIREGGSTRRTESDVHFVSVAGLLRPTYHRAVTFRNTFKPMRGPSMSPAPNSTCRDR